LARIRGRQIGFVFQTFELLPRTTALKNVQLPLMYAQISKKRQRAMDALKRVGLEDKTRAWVRTLSGGQQQRISLMRALMLNPDLLLMDEPLGALDPITRIELQNELHEIFKTLNKTVVMVTHDIGEAGFFGDEIVLMREGQIIQRGTLSELIQSPANEFVTRFINAQRSSIGTLAGGTS